MAESILVFSASNSCTVVHSRRTNSHLHWILQLLGASMSMAGFGVEYANKTRHFGSTHSVLGTCNNNWCKLLYLIIYLKQV